MRKTLLSFLIRRICRLGQSVFSFRIPDDFLFFPLFILFWNVKSFLNDSISFPGTFFSVFFFSSITFCFCENFVGIFISGCRISLHFNLTIALFNLVCETIIYPSSCLNSGARRRNNRRRDDGWAPPRPPPPAPLAPAVAPPAAAPERRGDDSPTIRIWPPTTTPMRTMRRIATDEDGRRGGDSPLAPNNCRSE